MVAAKFNARYLSLEEMREVASVLELLEMVGINELRAIHLEFDEMRVFTRVDDKAGPVQIGVVACMEDEDGYLDWNFIPSKAVSK